MEKSKGYLLGACYNKEVSHCHFVFWQRLKGHTGMGSFIVEKREGFRSALIGGCDHGETVGVRRRSRASSVIG